ncbi:Uncharacterised protein [Mycobacteroides abscessus subsp. abscessus]|nr:Uncharacterised protein [Mycobacteroides abscessus subsp. abscessus]
MSASDFGGVRDWSVGAGFDGVSLFLEERI